MITDIAPWRVTVKPEPTQTNFPHWAGTAIAIHVPPNGPFRVLIVNDERRLATWVRAENVHFNAVMTLEVAAG